MGKLLGSILRFLFSWIDSIVVRLITVLYRLLSDLSELVLYSDNIIKLIGRRIGLILGIFMLFKLAISLINYMISPDKISDKAKGGGRLIINVGVSLALLISINYIFKTAYRVQGVIVNSHIIEKIFFGEKGLIKSNNDYSDDSNTPTEKMDIGYYLYSAFFIPNNEVFGDACNDMWDVSVDWKEVKEGQSKSCFELLEDELDDEEMKSLGNSRNSLDMSYVLKDHDLVNEYHDETRDYYFNYTPIVSTVAGIVVLLVLLSFSMDLATRAVKLLFLQIISPIPIISNMDMGKGQDIFKKWGKECINTYLTVFIRLIAINFAVFMIVLLKGDYKSLFTNNIWLNIFLIIGCLMFAKQVPHLIEEFLGIKLNGLSLHPLKKFQEQALFGKQITGLAGAGLAAGAAFGTNALATEGGLFKRLGSGIGGAGSALARGTVGAVKGQSFGQVYKGAYNTSMQNRVSRADRKDDNVGWREMMSSKIAHATNQTTMGDTVKNANDNLQKLQNIYKSMMTSLEGADDVAGSITGTGMFTGQTFDGIKGLTKFEDEVKKTTIDRNSYAAGAAGDAQYNADVAAQQRRLKEIDDMKKARLDGIANGSITMPAAKRGTQNAITQGFDQMKELAKDINSATRTIDSDISIINPASNASLMNGLSKGVSQELAVNKVAAHAQTVDSYAAKKDQK